MKALSTRLFALNEAWKENANIYRQMAKQMNLTDMAMWALYTLRVEPGEMTQSRMCEFLHEPKQTINSAIRKMEANGWIELKPGKGRSMQIFLTDTGRQIQQEKIYPVIQAENNALSVLSPEEWDQLILFHQKYAAALRSEFMKLHRKESQ